MLQAKIERARFVGDEHMRIQLKMTALKQPVSVHRAVLQYRRDTSAIKQASLTSSKRDSLEEVVPYRDINIGYGVRSRVSLCGKHEMIYRRPKAFLYAQVLNPVKSVRVSNDGDNRIQRVRRNVGSGAPRALVGRGCTNERTVPDVASFRPEWRERKGSTEKRPEARLILFSIRALKDWRAYSRHAVSRSHEHGKREAYSLPFEERGRKTGEGVVFTIELHPKTIDRKHEVVLYVRRRLRERHHRIHHRRVDFGTRWFRGRDTSSK